MLVVPRERSLVNSPIGCLLGGSGSGRTMSGSAHNSWANVSQLSPGATLARVQAERWASDSNDAILAKLNDKIGGMLEGLSDATERQAQEQIQEELLKRRGDLGAKFGKMPAAKFREEVVKLAPQEEQFYACSGVKYQLICV